MNYKKNFKDKDTLKKRFMKRVEIVTESGCWIWIGAMFSSGYGQYNTRSAHRVSWEIFRSSIPEDKLVLHHCDVKCCVNPNHLYLGTALDNARDMIVRNRKPMGDKHWRRLNPHRLRGDDATIRKLNSEQVIAIRGSTGKSKRQLASEYGVSRVTIDRIQKRQSWNHI